MFGMLGTAGGSAVSALECRRVALTLILAGTLAMVAVPVVYGEHDVPLSRLVLRFRRPVTLGSGPVLYSRFGPVLHEPAIAVNARSDAVLSWQSEGLGVESAVGSVSTNRWQHPVVLAAEGDTNGELGAWVSNPGFVRAV